MLIESPRHSSEKLYAQDAREANEKFALSDDRV